MKDTKSFLNNIVLSEASNDFLETDKMRINYLKSIGCENFCSQMAFRWDDDDENGHLSRFLF